MGATGATAAGLFGFGPKGNKARREESVRRASENAIATSVTIAPPPPPPSVFNAANQGAAAMNDAARRYRRQRGAGLAANTSNGAAGDLGTAPTFRKQLLGR